MCTSSGLPKQEEGLPDDCEGTVSHGRSEEVTTLCPSPRASSVFELDVVMLEIDR